MKVETFKAIQTIKYVLQVLHPAECTSRVIKVFHRDNKHYSSIDLFLVINMRLARSKQKAKHKAACDEREEKDCTFQIKECRRKTKKDVVEATTKMAEEACLKHQQILEKAYKPCHIDQITTPTEKTSEKYTKCMQKIQIQCGR